MNKLLIRYDHFKTNYFKDTTRQMTNNNLEIYFKYILQYQLICAQLLRLLVNQCIQTEIYKEVFFFVI